MINFFKFLKKYYLQSINKQQATDKLRLLIETNHWNVYRPLPNLTKIAKQLNHKEHITLSAITRLIHCGVLLQGLNGELYINAAWNELYG